MLAMENSKYVATALNNIAALNLSGTIDKGQWEKVVMDYFLEDDRAMLTLSDSENESDDEEIPDLGKNIFIEEDIVESSDAVMGKKRRSTVLLSWKKGKCSRAVFLQESVEIPEALSPGQTCVANARGTTKVFRFANLSEAVKSAKLKKHKLHYSLDLHFLIIGHTKFAPDWRFGLIKQSFRKTIVNTLSEIAGVVKDSTVTGLNIPQLVGLEDGTVLVESYGWQHLTPYFRALPQIKQYQHFRRITFSLQSSMLWSLVLLSPRSVRTVGTRLQLLLNADILPPIDDLPVQETPGLDTARETYLFEKIREFCDEEAVDITCPAPKSRAGQKQAL
ncbi:uncharacterized protein LOC135563592 [Oncorhynchus nerka]|uniref:uncharacterized protein LOC135563592 n=1 Tax=Oncorhynchus nerka TaxID=8023 RepID=UPI0031B8607D